MRKDMYKYFKLNTKGEKYGYFVEFEPCYLGLGRNGNGRKYTMWGNYNWIIGETDTRNYTFIDLFHGYCIVYAYYFKKMNPDWEIGFLMYESCIGERYKHVFCYKKLDDGRVLFSDARGITDNVDEFFDDFAFAADTMAVYTKERGRKKRYKELLAEAEDEYNICDSIVRQMVQVAYNIMYERFGIGNNYT